jgi:hypothetical protein
VTRRPRASRRIEQENQTDFAQASDLTPDDKMLRVTAVAVCVAAAEAFVPMGGVRVRTMPMRRAISMRQASSD